MTTTTPLNAFNFLNVAAFALSWALNSEVELGPGADDEFWSFLGGMRELGRRYQSIVTPAEATYLASHLVLLCQGVFAFTQMLPRYRSSPLLKDGVSHWFFASIVSQLVWSIDLGIENLLGALLSVVFMGIMVFCNSQILIKQAALTDEHQEPEEYWLLRFPFSLHAGWTLAVFVMCINGLITFLEWGAGIRLTFGFLSLIAFIAMSWKMLFANGPKPNYAIPAILSWVCFGIAFDIEPVEDMEEYFELGFKIISGLVGLGIGGITAFLYYTKEGKKEIDSKAEGTDYVAPTNAALV